MDENKEIIEKVDEPIEMNTEKVSEGTNESMEGTEVSLGEEGTLNTEENENNEQLTQGQISQIDDLLHTLRDGINIMSQDWLATAKDYGLTDSEMTELGIFNSEHARLKPDDISEEEAKEWDYMNGIDKLTEEDINKIFPDKNHKIYGLTIDITRDRIHEACREYFELVSMKREYSTVLEQYFKLIEEQEEATLALKRAAAEAEVDPVLRQAMIDECDSYYYMKYLKWLREPISEQQKKAIITALSNADKVLYYNNRCRKKLDSMKISPMIILELNKFENNQLSPTYVTNQGVLVLYFMTFVAYANLNNRIETGKVMCMVNTFDRYIRKTIFTEEQRSEILESIIALENQFLGECPVPSPTEHQITPPTTDIPEVPDNISGD